MRFEEDMPPYMADSDLGYPGIFMGQVDNEYIVAFDAGPEKRVPQSWVTLLGATP